MRASPGPQHNPRGGAFDLHEYVIDSIIKVEPNMPGGDKQPLAKPESKFPAIVGIMILLQQGYNYGTSHT